MKSVTMQVRSQFPRQACLSKISEVQPDWTSRTVRSGSRLKLLENRSSVPPAEPEDFHFNRPARHFEDRDQKQPVGIADLELFMTGVSENRDESLGAQAAQLRKRELPPVAGYEILEELGRGGMAIVYRARQTKLNRLVALKVLVSAHHASQEMWERFQSEARTIAGLANPGIVQIFEVGTTDGLPYIALEYVAGGSLASRLAKGPISNREAAELILQMATAMGAAHKSGIVHRDLKPANVLLDNSGQPKIADFGIAKDISAASQTRTGDVIGTPNYMAPEQASGISKSIGPATDVYALGAILYELLTGRPPFRGQDPVETVLLVLTQEPVTVRRLAPRVDLDLDTICAKCLQKDQRKRYCDASELAADLKRFLAGEPIHARRTSIVERAGKWVRRHPAWSALIAVSALSIGGFSGYATWKNNELSKLLEERNRSLVRSEVNFRNALNAVTRRIYSEGALESDPVREELEFFQTIRRQEGNSEAARWERASAAGWCGTLLAKVNQNEEAEIAFAESLDGFQKLNREFPDRHVHRRELADVQERYANFLSAQLRFDESQIQFAAATRNVEGLLKELQRDDSNLDSETKTETEIVLKARLGRVLNNYGVMLRQSGANPLPIYERTIEIRSALVQSEPTNGSHTYDLAVTRMNLGAYYQSLDELDQAKEIYREVLASLEKLDSEYLGNDEVRRTVIGAQLNLAFVFSQSEDQEAIKWYQAATKLIEEWIALSPRSVSARQMLIDARVNWAKFALQINDLAGARKQLKDVIRWYENLLLEYPDNAAYKQQLEKMKAYLEDVEKAEAEEMS